jgi:hypothetical protein
MITSNSDGVCIFFGNGEKCSGQKKRPSASVPAR